jgi:drug/metabolite transporter (DMT)-like permease
MLAFVPMTLADLAAYGLAGLLAVGGHLMLTSAFARAEASRLAPIEYTALIWASLLGYAMFGEVPLITTYAGALLIVAGAVAVSRR